MDKVYIIFGSKSDFEVYESVFKELKERKVPSTLKTFSAHREPKQLIEYLSIENPKLIIAGAGLSSALPGFLALHCDATVIGIPVSANYSGLDALLSTHQMPSGIPVLGTGINASKVAAEYAELIFKSKFSKIVLVRRSNAMAIQNAIKKAEEKLNNEKIPFETITEADYKEKDAIYLDFLELEKTKTVDNKGKFVLFIPVKLDSNEKDSLKLLELTKNGLWLGLNRGDNAALAAIKLLKQT
ncbi:MAG: hypothetical protein COT15_02940 [Candidatus Diapherotrites archaeon CG08_land_8_20_14_0_20_34_12]|nr:MAG: hypothetical protein COT15_02940 [Candidatus Diapherotrites archaeon CG08_land_8_20_14_0_20_34_12]